MSICQSCKQDKVDVAYYPASYNVQLFELATGTHPLLPESAGLICYGCTEDFHQMFYTVRRVLLSRGWIT